MAGIIHRLREAAEEATGRTVVEGERLELLETMERDYSALRKELDMLGWTVMDYISGQPQEVNAASRRKFAAQARYVWEQDPQAGAATDLLNDFTFGRGVPRPRAKDEKVQEVIDEAWDDTDNQIALTSYSAQIALGTDLSLQSNLFFLMFDDGEDGRIKLGLLDHDTVETAVRDPDNRLRVLYYVAKERRVDWDYTNDQPKVDYTDNSTKVLYYEHWRNVSDLKDQDAKLSGPPSKKQGKGKVYHVAVNRRTEQVFGTPTMRRTIRWMTSYNDFLRARVDLMAAAAAYVMKRKVKGTPQQVARLAAKAVSRESPLAASVTRSGEELTLGARAGSVITENEGVSHEPFTLNTNAGNAAQDAELLLGQSAMATPFPKHYYGGDPGSLAGSTSLELPVLKAVESRGEVFEQVFRWFLDRVIERAVDAGRLDRYADPSEEEQAKNLSPAPDTGQFGEGGTAPPEQITAAHEDKGIDEKRTERNLSYEFSMPSPLRRMMTDLVTAITAIAQTFDPNGTNMELSRVLLTIALGEGLEVNDPAEEVEKVFPPGYEDPAITAAMAQSRGGVQPGPSTGGFGPPGNPQGENNPYSAPMRATTNDQLAEAASTRGRLGQPVLWVAEGKAVVPATDDGWGDVESIVSERLAALAASTNGSHDGA